jgi:hypothetical protein
MTTKDEVRGRNSELVTMPGQFWVPITETMTFAEVYSRGSQAWREERKFQSGTTYSEA